MALELADIFRQYGTAYRQKYSAHLLPSHRRALRDIERCRTEALGGQVFTCSACGEVQYSYHSCEVTAPFSCRNRHCPKCQHERAQEWLQFQQELLLDAPYFFLTFTIPAELRIFASRNQKLFYHTLFRASAQATQILARDPRFIGGQIGLVGVLHTWTRNLVYHPHIHYLVPGGGLDPDLHTWRKARKKYFMPVPALSKLFRARFQHLLRETPIFAKIPSRVWYKDWVVHCKAVGNGQAALKYLAPYIYRVAISNRRLTKMVDTGHMESSLVTFQYRASKTRQLKHCTLSAEKFIHRFLQHVLPRDFVKIRYFGFFGAALRPRLLSLHQQLEQESLIESTSSQPDTASGSTTSNVSQAARLCPKCGQPMRFQRTLAPNPCRSP